jgi:hypothetical protein
VLLLPTLLASGTESPLSKFRRNFHSIADKVAEVDISYLALASARIAPRIAAATFTPLLTAPSMVAGYSLSV